MRDRVCVRVCLNLLKRNYLESVILPRPKSNFYMIMQLPPKEPPRRSTVVSMCVRVRVCLRMCVCVHVLRAHDDTPVSQPRPLRR